MTASSDDATVHDTMREPLTTDELDYIIASRGRVPDDDGDDDGDGGDAPAETLPPSRRILAAVGPDATGRDRRKPTDRRKPPAHREPPERAHWTTRLALAGVVGAVILILLGIMAGIGPAASSKAHADTAAPAAVAAPAMSANSCDRALTYGRAVVTRQTGYVGGSGSSRRYWTSIVLESTGDTYRLVWDRGVSSNALATLVSPPVRGITGLVDARRSWGFMSRSAHVAAHVGLVDVNTGLYRTIVC